VYVRGWDLEVTQSQKEKFSSSSAFYWHSKTDQCPSTLSLLRITRV
jgi:hypothetical protein